MGELKTSLDDIFIIQKEISSEVEDRAVENIQSCNQREKHHEETEQKEGGRGTVCQDHENIRKEERRGKNSNKLL